MPEYNVMWQEKISANSPREAAEIAANKMRGRYYFATKFNVIDPLNIYVIDLNAIDIEVTRGLVRKPQITNIFQKDTS